MKSKEEKKYRQLLQTKIGGPVYKIYYDGKMFKLKEGQEALFSKDQILDILGIDYSDMSNSDRAFITILFNHCMTRFQNRAWDIGQPWGCLRVSHKSGDAVYLHGYTMDPAKQQAMKKQKHYRSIGHYISEKKQERAFLVATGTEDNKQIELPIREEITSFRID